MRTSNTAHRRIRRRNPGIRDCFSLAVSAGIEMAPRGALDRERSCHAHTDTGAGKCAGDRKCPLGRIFCGLGHSDRRSPLGLLLLGRRRGRTADRRRPRPNTSSGRGWPGRRGRAGGARGPSGGRGSMPPRFAGRRRCGFRGLSFFSWSGPRRQPKTRVRTAGRSAGTRQENGCPRLRFSPGSLPTASLCRGTGAVPFPASSGHRRASVRDGRRRAQTRRTSVAAAPGPAKPCPGGGIGGSTTDPPCGPARRPSEQETANSLAVTVTSLPSCRR